MYYIKTVCPLSHHNNAFVATGVLGHIHVRLHVTAGIQETQECSSYH